MLRRRRSTVVAAALSLAVASPWAGPARAGHSESAANGGIGYPTVAAALADLRSREDVTVTERDGWTVIEDPGAGTFWSFTPPDHPAYPAAVKRTVVERDGQTFIEMRALCQAAEAPCDALVAEFEALNRDIAASAQNPSAPVPPQWTPSAQQKARAEQTLSAFLKATDDERYRDAYQLFTAGMKTLMPFERFRSHEQTFRTASGGEAARSDIRATWYNDPPNAAAPGVYAAFDITCRFRNINLCTEVVILHQQEDGTFLVMRHERSYVDKEHEALLRDQHRKRQTP